MHFYLYNVFNYQLTFVSLSLRFKKSSILKKKKGVPCGTPFKSDYLILILAVFLTVFFL